MLIEYADRIQVGSPVLLFASMVSMHFITIEPGKSFSNSHGHYFHDDMVGMKYGK